MDIAEAATTEEMVVQQIKYGITKWNLLRQGGNYFLQIKQGDEQYLYPLEYDARHKRLHPYSEDLMTMDPMDLKAIQVMARAEFGDHPRENPAGVQGRTPLLLKRRVAVVLKSIMKKRPGRPSREDIGRAFGIATGMLQRQGYMVKGSRELTASGRAKEASMEDWKRAEADQVFSAWVEGRSSKNPEKPSKKPSKKQPTGKTTKKPSRKPSKKPSKKTSKKIPPKKVAKSKPKRSVKEMIRGFGR